MSDIYITIKSLLDSHTTMGKQCGVFIQGNITVNENKWKTDTYYNIDEPCKLDTKDTNDHIVYGSFV